MNKHIVATIHPFVREQEIYVYIDGECVTITKCIIDDMCEKIYELCEKYDINRVDFQGGQLYSLKFRDDFIANKFGNRHIEIHIH